MQSRVITGLAIMGYEPLYYAVQKNGKCTRCVLVRFYFYFRLVLYIFETFIIKQLFHPRILDMR